MMPGDDEVFVSAALPNSGLEEFLLAANRAGQRGLEEVLFRNLAAAIASAISNEVPSASPREASLLEQIVDLCGEGNTNIVVRDEVYRLAGRLLADLPEQIQSQFVNLCLRRLSQDLVGGHDSRRWRPIAYVLAANYSLIKSRTLRQQLIEMLKLLISENAAYKNDFFIEDLLLIHQKMRLDTLERLKEMLDSRKAAEEISL
ncbi:MAG: hypothetical protein NTY38_09015 [Acidobacteria bacterium]|nr:hypothetical protein [Acidobacteriota bacterium]